jgi:hypothetical protein
MGFLYLDATMLQLASTPIASSVYVRLVEGCIHIVRWCVKCYYGSFLITTKVTMPSLFMINTRYADCYPIMLLRSVIQEAGGELLNVPIDNKSNVIASEWYDKWVRDMATVLPGKKLILTSNMADVARREVQAALARHIQQRDAEYRVIELDAYFEGGNTFYLEEGNFLLHGNNAGGQYLNASGEYIFDPAEQTEVIKKVLTPEGVTVLPITLAREVSGIKSPIHTHFTYHLDCFMQAMPDGRLLVLNAKMLSDDSLQMLKDNLGDRLVDLAYSDYLKKPMLLNFLTVPNDEGKLRIISGVLPTEVHAKLIDIGYLLTTPETFCETSPYYDGDYSDSVITQMQGPAGSSAADTAGFVSVLNNGFNNVFNAGGSGGLHCLVLDVPRLGALTATNTLANDNNEGKAPLVHSYEEVVAKQQPQRSFPFAAPLASASVSAVKTQRNQPKPQDLSGKPKEGSGLYMLRMFSGNNSTSKVAGKSNVADLESSLASLELNVSYFGGENDLAKTSIAMLTFKLLTISTAVDKVIKAFSRALSFPNIDFNPYLTRFKATHSKFLAAASACMASIEEYVQDGKNIVDYLLVAANRHIQAIGVVFAALAVPETAKTILGDFISQGEELRTKQVALIKKVGDNPLLLEDSNHLQTTADKNPASTGELCPKTNNVLTAMLTNRDLVEARQEVHDSGDGAFNAQAQVDLCASEIVKYVQMYSDGLDNGHSFLLQPETVLSYLNPMIREMKKIVGLVGLHAETYGENVVKSILVPLQKIIGGQLRVFATKIQGVKGDNLSMLREKMNQLGVLAAKLGVECSVSPALNAVTTGQAPNAVLYPSNSGASIVVAVAVPGKK